MIRSILLVFSLMIVPNYWVSCQINVNNFRQEMLNEHNSKRSLHCTASMVLNTSLNTIAQNHAQYLATNNLFQHSSTPGLGENLYMKWSSNAITSLSGSTPTKSWYDEILAYNYSNPKFSSTTGHFTQVIWKNSIQLGVGIALSSNNQKVYVVAEYYPPGNYLGQFANNVPPLCSG